MPRYIDREKLIERLEYYLGHTGGEAHYAYSVALKEVRNAPAEDALPVVHGEWIPYAKKFREIASYGRYYSYVIPLNYKCSVCNIISENIEPYCYCGAKMDGDVIKSMKRAGDSAKNVTESLKNVINAFENADRCVCCGEIVPEGRQVCPGCETGGECDG